ncbi:hypothetical protein MMC25_006804 [Agyrium rufum]|nr:hypothetical protein [Agyrium rufum]
MGMIRKYAAEDMPIYMFTEGKSVMLSCTSAYLFGLHETTSVLDREPGRTHLLQALRDFFEGTFWFTEFPQLITPLHRLGIRLVPDASLRAQEVIEQSYINIRDTYQPIAVHGGTVNGPRSAVKTPANVYADLHKQLLNFNPTLENAEDHATAEMMDHLIACYEGVGITLTYALCKLS